MFSLAGKSVLVTGGSKGIGRGIASVFAAAGAHVAIAARSQADLDSAVAALDGLGAGKVIGVAVDVSDPRLLHRDGRRGRRAPSADSMCCAPTRASSPTRRCRR